MQLLEHFKELTIHPKNAEQLKGLILQLAIQGKLTQKWREQNPDVESASALLEKIKEEKNQLVKEKKIKKEKALPEITEEEIPFKVEESWVWTKIGVISQIVGGGTPKSSNPEFFTEDGIPWFTPADLGKNKSKYIEKGRRDVTELGLAKSSAQLMPAGSILFSSRAPIGHTAITTRDFCTNQGFKSSVPIKMEMNEFIYLYLNSIVKEVNENASGTTFKEVSGAIVKNFSFPLPPLEEQKAIVSIVNQLFAEVDQLEVQTKERVQLKNDFVSSVLRQLSEAKEVNGEWTFLQQHFKSFFNTKEAVKKLRETILQLAVQGKLTHHWRLSHPLGGDAEGRGGIESASVLLEKIKAEKEQLIKEKKIKKEKPLPEISAEEIPYELPDGWVWCRLGETLLYSDAGKSPNCEKRPVTENEWGVLTTTAIQQNWFDETANKVLPDKFEINKQQIVEIGDILITRAGPINRTGVACKVDRLNFNLILSDKTIRLKYIPDALYPDCIVQFLNSTEIRALLLDKMIGMASSQVNISQANIKGIPFPLPPLEEQKAIVAKVNSLMALCDQLEQQIELNTKQIEDLMGSCLKEVFN